jgi:hypothetical protein
MYRRLVWIGLLGPVEAALSRQQRPTLRGFVRGVLPVVRVATVQTGLKVEDWKTTQPAAAKTGEAVNIMWRFDGNGRFPNIHPPSEWRGDRNILWKTPVEIGGYSSPIVARDKVFVTAEEEEDFCSSPIFVGDQIILSWGRLLALNAKDGRTLWKWESKTCISAPC